MPPKKDKKKSKESIPAQEGVGKGVPDAESLEMFEKLKAMMAPSQGTGSRHVGSVKSAEEAIASNKEYKFWETQPVPQLGGVVTDYGPIEPDNENIQQEPYNLPNGYEWCVIDIDKENELLELYTLLNKNYVEDDDNMFRFAYSPAFLKWALQPPGFIKDWHIGVRVSTSKKLVGFISGTPAHVRVGDSSVKMTEINFLCVLKKLRSKRLAPVLIKEVTRRVHLKGVFQALYTAGVYLPTPFTTCKYWHRNLNPKKLIDIGFSPMPRDRTMAQTIRKYRLPEETRVRGIRPMKKEDGLGVHKLLTTNLQKYRVSALFDSIEEVLHWFLPRDQVITSYVVEDTETGEITDFFSFYTLNSTICRHPEHNMLYAAYSFYNVSTKVAYEKLMKDALIVARSKGYDVFNSLDLMENSSILEELDFGVGDGDLHYYMYNYKCPSSTPGDIGVVLL
eukprot:Nk52_evm10s2657 gene=Nk52_evmTU10s2657